MSDNLDRLVRDAVNKADFSPITAPYEAAIAALQSERDRLKHYRSTACHHEQHAACRLQCKFCELQCSCECHAGTEAPNLPTYQDLKARLEEAERLLRAVYSDGVLRPHLATIREYFANRDKEAKDV